MSFVYNLHVDDKDFSLIAFQYHLVQKYEENGKPAGGVQGGRIRFLLEMTDDSFFPSWLFDYKSTHDGSITIMRIDQASKYKEVKFTKAYLVNMSESFSVDKEPALLPEDTLPVQFEIYQWTTHLQDTLNKSYVLMVEISAETITIDGIAHDNKW